MTTPDIDEPEYAGDEINIYEWPQPACEITDVIDHGSSSVVVRSYRDAKALHESLSRLIAHMEQPNEH